MNSSTESLILQLSEKMGSFSEVVWNTYLKQAYIQNGIYLIIFPFFIYLIIPAYKLIKKKSTPIDDSCNAEWSDPFPAYLCLFLYGMLCVMFTFFWFDSLIAIINPEYWVIQNLLSTIK